MRTTITLEPDVARLIEEEVHRTRRPFKQVVNQALRRGLGPSYRRKAKRVEVALHHAVLAPGIDPVALNRLADELEQESTLAKR